MKKNVEIPATPKNILSSDDLFENASEETLRKLASDDQFMEEVENEMAQLDHLSQEVKQGIQELRELCQKM